MHTKEVWMILSGMCLEGFLSLWWVINVLRISIASLCDLINVFLISLHLQLKN